MAINSVFFFVAIVLIFVLYVQDYALEIQNIQKNFVLCVQKFAKLVPKNAANMPHITLAAKLVLKLVQNALKFVLNFKLSSFVITFREGNYPSL